MTHKQRIISSDNTDQYQSWRAPRVIGPISNQYDGKSEPPTASEVQALQSEAYKESYELGRKEGQQQGYQEGLQNARAELSESINTLKGIINSLSAPVNELDEQVENNLLELVLLIARHLVRREIRTEPGEIVAVVREALSVLPISSRNPVIYLHPEDIDMVKQALSLGDEHTSWRLEEDLLLTRGDCRVETQSSYIDATIDSRLSAIAAKMLGGERNSDEQS